MLTQIYDLLNYLSQLPEHLDELFARSGLIPYALVWLNLFLETGGLVMNFLPGNSVVLGASAYAAGSDSVSIQALILIFATSTLLGDTTSFYLGRFFGRKYQKQTRLRFINQDHFEVAHEFFEENGRRTFLVSRFIPIFRGIMPFAAGFTQTHPRVVWPFIAAGVFLWNLVYISVGYFFGNIPAVQENFGLLLLIVALATMIPTLILVSHTVRKFRKALAIKRAGREEREKSPDDLANKLEGKDPPEDDS